MAKHQTYLTCVHRLRTRVQTHHNDVLQPRRTDGIGGKMTPSDTRVAMTKAVASTMWSQLQAGARGQTPSPPTTFPASSTPVHPLFRPLPHLRSGRFSGIQRANVERRTPGCARKATSHEAGPCLAASPPCRCMPLPAFVGEHTTGRRLLWG